MHETFLQVLEGYSGLISAIATIAIGAFTFFLWRSTSKLWQSGEKQLKIAEVQIENAKKSVDAMMQSNRPYAIVTSAVIRGFRHDEYNAAQLSGGLQREATIADFAANANEIHRANVKPEVTIQIKNFGNSPIWLYEFWCTFLMLPTLPDKPQFHETNKQNLHNIPIPPNETFNWNGIPIESATSPGEITYEELLRIKRGEQRLYIWGYVRYWDIFKVDLRISSFGWEFDHETNVCRYIKSPNYWITT